MQNGSREIYLIKLLPIQSIDSVSVRNITKKSPLVGLFSQVRSHFLNPEWTREGVNYHLSDMIIVNAEIL